MSELQTTSYKLQTRDALRVAFIMYQGNMYSGGQGVYLRYITRELVRIQAAVALDAHPDRFVRGLIHSDGCRSTNRVRGRNGRSYEYVRYQFCNHSDDIRALFCEACDRLALEWRRMNAVTISVARSESVSRLEAIVGPKS